MKKNPYRFLQYIKNYRFHSIFFKNLLLILCVIMLPFMCILGILYYTYAQIQISEEKAYVDGTNTMICKDVESLFSELQNKLYMTSLDNDVNLFYYAHSMDDTMFYNFRNISKFISLLSITTDVIGDVCIYAPHTQTVISSAGRYHYDKFSDKECIDRWVDSAENFQFEYLNRMVYKEQRENICIYYTAQLGTKRKGVSIIQIDMNKFAKKFVYENVAKITLISDGQVLYDSAGGLNGSYIENIEDLMQASGDEIVVYNQLSQNNLELIVRLDRHALYEKLEGIRLLLVTCVCILVLLTILLVFYISGKIFDPMTEILKTLEEVPKPEEDAILRNKDELSYIMNSISSTISRSRDVEEELVERVSLLKKAQAVALQSQINPHFINNTLETINWMAISKLGRKNDLSDMLNSLSRLMRISLETSDTFVTLEKELEYVEKYIFIQQKRLQGRFDVIFHIPEELKSCKIIKMVLQPVVENAINYGILPFDRKGKLQIEAVRVEDKVCIHVMDSGFGMAQEEVDEINHSIRKTVIKESNHIGLSNVNQRIILAFGEEYGVIFRSKVGEGTVVTLEIPYQL